MLQLFAKNYNYRRLYPSPTFFSGQSLKDCDLLIRGISLFHLNQTIGILGHTDLFTVVFAIITTHPYPGPYQNTENMKLHCSGGMLSLQSISWLFRRIIFYPQFFSNNILTMDDACIPKLDNFRRFHSLLSIHGKYTYDSSSIL